MHLARNYRISVVGSPGSGKTELAKRLAERLRIPHVDLDHLRWGPNWTPYPRGVFRDRVSRALTGDRWVADGYYRAVTDIVWTRAATIIWLDYSLSVTMSQRVVRTIRRIISQEELWAGNRQRLSPLISGRSSVLLSPLLHLWGGKIDPRVCQGILHASSPSSTPTAAGSSKRSLAVNQAPLSHDNEESRSRIRRRQGSWSARHWA